eukprot:879132-Alexandrium_andersonii.AAC.1
MHYSTSWFGGLPDRVHHLVFGQENLATIIETMGGQAALADCLERAQLEPIARGLGSDPGCRRPTVGLLRLQVL